MELMRDELRKYDGQHIWCVDPGVIGTGIARWERWCTDELHPPTGTYQITPTMSSRARWEIRFHNMMDLFTNRLVSHIPSVVVIESAGLWGQSARSTTAALQGDTFKLAYLIGAMLYASTMCGSIAMLIAPQDWKGQLSKKMVSNRIQAVLNVGSKSMWVREHVSDAVGMGLSLMGAL
jgi:hypothetical protein